MPYARKEVSCYESDEGATWRACSLNLLRTQTFQDRSRAMSCQRLPTWRAPGYENSSPVSHLSLFENAKTKAVDLTIQMCLLTMPYLVSRGYSAR